MKLSIYQCNNVDVIKLHGCADATNIADLYELIDKYKDKSVIAFDLSDVEYLNTFVLTALTKTYKKHRILIFTSDVVIFNILYIVNLTKVIDTTSSLYEFEELCKNCQNKKDLVNS